MDNGFEKLNLFFERIKTLTFFQRIFNWRSLKSLSYEAYEEFRTLISSITAKYKENAQVNNDISLLKKENEHLNISHLTSQSDLNMLKDKLSEINSKNLDLTAQLATKEETIRQTQKIQKEQEIELASSKEKINQLTQDNSLLKKDNTIFKQTEEDRKIKYEKDISALNLIREQIQDDRKREIEKLHKDEIEKLKSLKETWAKHQDKVKETIKMICQKHTIEYVEKVPFKGSPDNTIKICDEFFIFDAKSPASDDLNNFPIYIKNQTESVKKYVKEENVRKDVFLVIPSSTVEVIDQFSYNLGDYSVYIVTIDVLEPLVLALKKIEDYEFVDQLSPEERENICRIIGKFAHMTKRRIQIDHFFAWEFLDILTKCKVDLPKEILDKVIEFEKSEKLNPPIERRAKQIITKELESDTDKIRKEAEVKEIVFPPSLQKNLNRLPLYEGDDIDKIL